MTRIREVQDESRYEVKWQYLEGNHGYRQGFVHGTGWLVNNATSATTNQIHFTHELSADDVASLALYLSVCGKFDSFSFIRSFRRWLEGRLGTQPRAKAQCQAGSCFDRR